MRRISGPWGSVRMLWWAEIGACAVDDDGHLFERYKGGWHWRGPIESAEVSPGLERDAEALLDRWRDAFDAEAEARWYYECSVLR